MNIFILFLLYFFKIQAFPISAGISAIKPNRSLQDIINKAEKAILNNKKTWQ